MADMDKKLLGRYGEQLAADFLRKKGYTILAQGYHSHFGEIDLIAQKDDIVAFVEVKTRQSQSYLPASAAVGAKKRQSIILTARQWITVNKCEKQFSFDIIEIYVATKEIRHIKNAFV